MSEREEKRRKDDKKECCRCGVLKRVDRCSGCGAPMVLSGVDAGDGSGMTHLEVEAVGKEVCFLCADCGDDLGPEGVKELLQDGKKVCQLLC